MKRSRIQVWSWLTIGSALCIAAGAVALSAVLGLSLITTNAVALAAFAITPATVRRIVNMTALTVADANAAR